MSTARSRMPAAKGLFEEVSSIFLHAGCSKDLMSYLVAKLAVFELPAQALQYTMILAWLIEIIVSSISLQISKPKNEEQDATLSELDDELDKLLADIRVIGCIRKHKTLFYGILNNYSNPAIFIRVAKLIGDHEHVVECHLESGEFDQSIEVIRQIGRDDLFYKYGHILMKRKPREFVDALIEQKSVQPAKLIPILIQENPYYNQCSETIRYLEHCTRVLKSDSRIVHNYLFELYARHRGEETLLKYLENEVSVNNRQQYHLDLQLCLRLCTELKMFRVSVVLYSYMGLYDEAVNLALEFDVELAKSIAKRVESADHQKRLWLLIAGNILCKNADIRVATGLLLESRMLRIEDILPFFPHYTTIDYFKDAYRQSLQDYKNQLMSLKDDTYYNIADEIRNEIEAFKNRYSIIKVGQKCETCSKNIMAQNFFVYPCGHVFHEDCIAASYPKLSLDVMHNRNPEPKECCYCGDLLASGVDKPAPVVNDPTLTGS